MMPYRDTPPTDRPLPPVGPQAGELPPEVAAFLDRLRRLPLGTWAEAGRMLEALDAASARRASPSRRATAAGPEALHGAEVRAELRRVVNAMPRQAAQIRGRILDLATVAQGFVHRSDAARMKKAALVAALALVARPALGDERFDRAYAPFAASIPVGSLLAAGEPRERAPTTADADLEARD